MALLLLLGAELGLRAAGLRPGYAADQIGGWRALSAQDGPVQTREGGAFHLRTNASGLRTATPPGPAPGRVRVAVLGDSVPFGWGVDEGETLTEAAAAALAAAGRADVDLINAAQPGYSTVQATRLLGATLPAWAPELALIFLPLHDHNRVLVSDAEHLRGAMGALARLRVALATRSRLYEGLRRLLFPLAGQPFVLADEAGAGPRVPRVSAAERADALSAAQATAAGWGGRLLIGHLPFAAELRGQWGPREAEAETQAWAEENDAPLIDLRGCCSGEALLLPADPGHYSAAGHRAVGQALAAALLPLLPPPAAQTPLPEPP